MQSRFVHFPRFWSIANSFLVWTWSQIRTHFDQNRNIVSYNVFMKFWLFQGAFASPGTASVSAIVTSFLVDYFIIHLTGDIYFDGDKRWNFYHFGHLVPKIISTENYLRRIFISVEYLSPSNIYLRRIYIVTKLIYTTRVVRVCWILLHVSIRGREQAQEQSSGRDVIGIIWPHYVSLQYVYCSCTSIFNILRFC